MNKKTVQNVFPIQLKKMENKEIINLTGATSAVIGG